MRTHTALILLVVGWLAATAAGLHLQQASRVRSLRGRRLGRAFVQLADEPASGGFLKDLFTTNRDTPEAQANQRAWARQQVRAAAASRTQLRSF
jgi:hypothetical protein